MGQGLYLPNELAYNAPRLIERIERDMEAYGPDVLSVLWTAGRSGTMSEVVQALEEERAAEAEAVAERRAVEGQAYRERCRRQLQTARRQVESRKGA